MPVDLLTESSTGPKDLLEVDVKAPMVSEGPVIQAAPESSLWDKMTSIDTFMDLFKDPEKEKAKAVQALVDSEALGISPDQAYRYRDLIDRGVKINPTASMKRTTLTERVKQSYDIGTKQNQIGEIGYQYVMTGDPKYLSEIEKIEMPEEYLAEGNVEKAVRSAAKMLPMMTDTALEAGWKSLGVGATFAGAAALLGQTGPQVALPEEIVTVPASFVAGMTIGGVSGAFEASMRKEAGLALSEIIKFKDTQGNTIDPNIARAAAFGIGVINGGIEVAQVGTLLKTIPGMNKLFSKALLETVASDTVKQKLLKLAGQYAGTVAKETAQEVAQESTNIVFEELAKKVNNAVTKGDIKPTDAAEVMKRLWDTAVESVQGFFVLAAPGMGARATGAAISGRKIGTEGQKIEGNVKPTVQGVQAQEVKPPTRPSMEPFPLGVQEDAAGRPATFIMADPSTGETFTVDAIEAEIGKKGEAVRYEPNVMQVAEAKAAMRMGREGETSIDDLIEGTQDIDAVVDRWIAQEREVTEDVQRQMQRQGEGQGTEGSAQGQVTEEGAVNIRPESDIISDIDLETDAGNILQADEGNVTGIPSLVMELGKSIYRDSMATVEEFTAELKKKAAKSWQQIEPHVRAMWEILKSNAKDILSAAIIIGATITGNDVIDLGFTGAEFPAIAAIGSVIGKQKLAAYKKIKGKGQLKETVRSSRGKAEIDKPYYERVAEARAAKAEKEAAITAQAKKQIDQAYQKGIAENEKKYMDEIRSALKNAREAYKSGHKEGVLRGKTRLNDALEQLNWMRQRRQKLTALRDFLDLDDTDLRKLTRKNPLLMSDAEFHSFAKDLEFRSIEYHEQLQAKLELIRLIQDRNLQNTENYRQAMKLPPINKMTTEQLREFYALLEPFEYGDVFLTQRELELVDRSKALEGIRTWREARERLAKESGLPMEAFYDPESKTPHKIKVSEFDKFRWDPVLRERNPWYKIMVEKTVASLLGSEMNSHRVESKVFELAKKAHTSRTRTAMERAIPQDERIFEYLEAPDDMKAVLAKDMTPEEIDYAAYIQGYFSKALGYLISTGAIHGKGRDNYMTHVRRSFMETFRDDGLVGAVRTMFTNYEQDEAVFQILDQSTGDILPLEKFFQFAMHRTGGLIPSKNITRSFMTYVTSFEKKKALDAIMPELDIYVQSLTPRVYTPRGLEIDRSLKTFMNQYINNKKGRVFDTTYVKQGGKVDLLLRGMRTFTTVLDLGLNIPVQVISFTGEQAATINLLGVKDYILGTERMRTVKGKEILKKYEAFTGRSAWEEFTAPGKEFTGRLSVGLFGMFNASTVLANKQFLLGSMTEDEWKSGELSTDRLADLRLEMGRFRAVPGSKSLVGSTSLGGMATQYRTWAIPYMRTILNDGAKVIRGFRTKTPGENLTSKEAKELYRFVSMSAIVLIARALISSDDDEDDNSFFGKMKRKFFQEALTGLQSFDAVWFSGFTPRMLTWAGRLMSNIKSLLLLEEYETKEGYKGIEGLKKQLIPRVAQQAYEVTTGEEE